MQSIKILSLSTLVLFFTACDSDDETNPTDDSVGSVFVEFDNVAGSSQLSLEASGSEDYMFETFTGEKFNLNSFKYYISKIQLSGPDGESYEDEMNVSADAEEIKGYYLIDESESASRFIELAAVPAGKYNSITFTVGIAEDGVQEGAAGGILDPANGAPFWNWNAGYIGFIMEGGAENSAQQEVQGHHGTTPAKSFAFHIGGWKDISPAEGETQQFFNNIKTITLSFGSDVSVSESLEPEIHVVTDAVKILGDIDFATTFAVHSPSGGVPFATNLESAFTVDHVHQ